MEKKIRKKTATYGIAAVLMAIVLGTLCYDLGVRFPAFQTVVLPTSASTPSLLTTFSSYEELRNFLGSYSRTQGPFPFYGPSDISILGPMLKVPEGIAQAGTNSFEHSTTNNQVAGVDEADTVKNDGEYIYVLSGNVVSILAAYPPTNATIVSRISFNGSYPVGIFVNGDRLAVLGCEYFDMPIKGYYESYEVKAKTFVSIYDIHDRANPVFLHDLALTGSFFNSRMIGEYVYFVVGEPAYVTYGLVTLPKFYSGGQVKEVAPSEIHYFNGSDNYYQFTTCVAMNIQNMTEAPTYYTVMMGGTSNMYVSPNNLYITFPKEWYGDTSIYRIHIQASNMTCEANGTVLGHELNQYSMDEYDGYFRIATSAYVNRTNHNNLYVLNMNLDVIGRLEDLAIDENLHSARFMGNRCYLVTFKAVDPLFVIDLSEPTNPSVLGNLTIPGYSDYLHPYDETHLIGVGKETAEAEEEYFAWYQGVKLSLFDVSNVTDPKQQSNYIIGDRGSDTPILRDSKAFLFDKARGLLVIPVSVAKIDQSQYPYGVPPSAYGVQVWQGAYVLNVSLNQGFVLKGRITHLSSSTDVWDSSLWVKRALYIEDTLYTISDKKIRMNRLDDDLTFLKDIELP